MPLEDYISDIKMAQLPNLSINNQTSEEEYSEHAELQPEVDKLSEKGDPYSEH